MWVRDCTKDHVLSQQFSFRVLLQSACVSRLPVCSTVWSPGFLSPPRLPQDLASYMKLACGDSIDNTTSGGWGVNCGWAGIARQERECERWLKKKRTVKMVTSPDPTESPNPTLTPSEEGMNKGKIFQSIQNNFISTFDWHPIESATHIPSYSKYIKLCLAFQQNYEKFQPAFANKRTRSAQISRKTSDDNIAHLCLLSCLALHDIVREKKLPPWHRDGLGFQSHFLVADEKANLR